MAKYQTGKHLEAFILLYLARQSGHGGAVLQWLKEILPNDWVIDGGRVYRTLRDLEATGALASAWRTDAPSAAPVRVYAITEDGYRRLNAWHEEISIRQASLTRFLEGYDAWRSALCSGPCD